MITKEIIDNQLFVYYNGVLIYKKWLKTGISLLFDNEGPSTWSYERDDNERC